MMIFLSNASAKRWLLPEMMSLRSILTQLMKKNVLIWSVHLTISAEDFRGGVRAVIRSRNILIDNSFSTQLKEQYDKFVFLGGDGIA